ncbi:MAG: hypothetical protein JRG73_01435 [Deltaproteobacteria bacterium]|nr:hypothetical protein [Deltaproteobacteria bacterium]
MAERKIRFLMCILIVGVLIKASLTLFTLFAETSGESITFSRAEAANTASQDKGDRLPSDGRGKKKEEGNHRSLIELIEKKERELQEKEEALRLEEERLKALKRDIEDKLAQINQISARLKVLTIKKDKHIEEKITKLAKVFESTPPEHVGTLLERLDTNIAAQILLHMNGKKAGAVWGYVEPDRALEIIKEMSKFR